MQVRSLTQSADSLDVSLSVPKLTFHPVDQPSFMRCPIGLGARRGRGRVGRRRGRCRCGGSTGRGGTLVLALDDGATLSLDRAGQTVAMTVSLHDIAGGWVAFF